MRPASKTTYLPLAIYFLTCALLFFLDFRGYVQFLHTFAQRVTTPFKETLYQTKTSLLGGFQGASSSPQSQKEREKLQGRVTFLEGQVSRMGVLSEENERMRYLLGANLPPSWKFEPVRVVSVYADSVYALVESPEVVGKPVISTHTGEIQEKGGIYVGRIENILGKQAEIFLPSRDNTRIPVVVRDRDTGDKRASGILVGRGGRAILDQVLTGEVLKANDLVLTAGDDTRPPELLIGTVGEILPVSAGAFQQAEVTPFIDYRKLQTIFVVTKY